MSFTKYVFIIPVCASYNIFGREARNLTFCVCAAQIVRYPGSIPTEQNFVTNTQ